MERTVWEALDLRSDDFGRLGAAFNECLRSRSEPPAGAPCTRTRTLHSVHPLRRKRLMMMLDGRKAELLVKGSVSSGTSELKHASELASNMVSAPCFAKTFGLLSVAGVPKELLGLDIHAAVLKAARAMLEQTLAQCQQLLTSKAVATPCAGAGIVAASGALWRRAEGAVRQRTENWLDKA